MSSAPILVTGAHRTGTTWVGRMLAAGSGTMYISEPLNSFHQPSVLRAKVANLYQYICEDNSSEFYPAFQRLLAYNLNVWAGARSVRSFADTRRISGHALASWRARAHHPRVLFKDPFAVFSLPWFVQRLGTKTVVVVRHPAAFVSSNKRLGWFFDFTDLLDQPLLMRDHLDPFRDAIASTPADDLVGQTSLLWTLIYRTVAKYSQSDPGIVVVRQEDLAGDPIQQFRQLYASLGLEYASGVETKIVASSQTSNPRESPAEDPYSTNLDSRSTIHSWHERLTTDEIDRVRSATEGVVGEFYPDSSWR